MLYNALGHSDIQVSRICLGTMTWGEQNTQEEAFEQMDYALDQGVNFWDTAELYAVPPRAETYGRTEEIIGHWLAKTGKRDEIVLASKMAGPSEISQHIRGGKSRFNREQITQALDASLKRLQTDYLDLYQLHWPERNTNFFGQLGYEAGEDPSDLTPMEETLEVLTQFVNQGKIRHIGLSNETPWGTMKFLQLAEQHDLSKIVTVQNPYSLLNRSYEVGLAEVSHRENVGLLGVFTAGLRGAEWQVFKRFGGSECAFEVVPALRPLFQRQCGESDGAVCGFGARQRFDADAIGAGVYQQSPVLDGEYHWRDYHGTAQREHRQHPC